MSKVKPFVASLIAFMVVIGIVTVATGLEPSLLKHSVGLGVLAGAYLLNPVRNWVSSKLGK